MKKKNLIVARKSIVAIKKISKGEKFSFTNLGVKRPGKGINPMKIKNIIGKRAKKNYLPDSLIKIN